MNYQSITNSHPAAQSGRDNDLKSAVVVQEEAEASTTKESSKGGTQPKKRKPRNVWTAAVSIAFSSSKSLLAYAPHTMIWTVKEDAALLRIVENHAFDDLHKNHWAQIATKHNNNRSGKQCRDRWQNHLRPDIRKGQWTKEEEQLIKEMHRSFGTK